MISLYKQGASDTEVRADLDMTLNLWNKLKLTDEEFGSVLLQGKTYTKAWWLTQGRTNLTTREFNAQLYKINMQNRFNWNDKTSSVDDEDEDAYEDEESIDKQIEALNQDVSIN